MSLTSDQREILLAARDKGSALAVRGGRIGTLSPVIEQLGDYRLLDSDRRITPYGIEALEREEPRMKPGTYILILTLAGLLVALAVSLLR